MTVSYNLRARTKTVWPRASRLFKEGDRVHCYHKTKQYSGVVVEVQGRNTSELEIYIRTDERVSSLPDSLFEGFGLRAPHYLFQFEDPSLESSFPKELVILPLTKQEINNHKHRKAAE